MYPQTYPNDGGLIPLSCVNNIPVTYIMVVYIIINMYLIISELHPGPKYSQSTTIVIVDIPVYMISCEYHTIQFLIAAKNLFRHFSSPQKKEEKHIPTGKTPYGSKYFLNPAVIIPSHTFSEATAGSIWYLHTTVIIYICIESLYSIK